VKGSMLTTVCNAAKTIINAIPFAEKMFCIVLEIVLAMVFTYHLRCVIFYTATYSFIRDFGI
jgi:hypothetical protein